MFPVSRTVPTFPSGKYTRLALAEEEQCEDLVLFMKLLYNLTAKDYIDFSSSESSSSSSSGGGGGGSEAPVVQRVQPVDVVVTGISIILPLMTEELLKVCDTPTHNSSLEGAMQLKFVLKCSS